MEQLTQLGSLAASAAAILGPAVLLCGPRVGPARALILGLRSRLFGWTGAVSQRTEDVAFLRERLPLANKDMYFVVSGPKGVGKSCIVNTAMQRTFGAVKLAVAPGQGVNDIVSDALKAITGVPITWLNQSNGARRVVFWHRFVFRIPPTIVLAAIERKADQKFADLESAARILTHAYGVRVVIDASVNSLPENAGKATKREVVLDAGPMSRDTIEQLPKLKSLHAALAATQLADIVWACVGGVPADYLGLDFMWESRHRSVAELGPTVEEFTDDLLRKAAHNIRSQVIANKRLQGLYDVFGTAGVTEVPESILLDMNLQRPSPDKVLRLSPRGGDYALVPADAPTALVLRFRGRAPTAEELKAVVAARQQSGAE